VRVFIDDDAIGTQAFENLERVGLTDSVAGRCAELHQPGRYVVQMRSTRLLSALGAATLLFAACGEDSPSDSAAPAPATESAATADTDSAAVAPELLQFTAPLVGGGEIDATSLAGKPTVFWFWAPN